MNKFSLSIDLNDRAPNEITTADRAFVVQALTDLAAKIQGI
jgi:hypothetical protein